MTTAPPSHHTGAMPNALHIPQAQRPNLPRRPTPTHIPRVRCPSTCSSRPLRPPPCPPPIRVPWACRPTLIVGPLRSDGRDAPHPTHRHNPPRRPTPTSHPTGATLNALPSESHGVLPNANRATAPFNLTGAKPYHLTHPPHAHLPLLPIPQSRYRRTTQRQPQTPSDLTGVMPFHPPWRLVPAHDTRPR